MYVEQILYDTRKLRCCTLNVAQSTCVNVYNGVCLFCCFVVIVADIVAPGKL